MEDDQDWCWVAIVSSNYVCHMKSVSVWGDFHVLCLISAHKTNSYVIAIFQWYLRNAHHELSWSWICHIWTCLSTIQTVWSEDFCYCNPFHYTARNILIVFFTFKLWNILLKGCLTGIFPSQIVVYTEQCYLKVERKSRPLLFTCIYTLMYLSKNEIYLPLLDYWLWKTPKLP